MSDHHHATDLVALQALARAVLAQLYGRQDKRVLLSIRYEGAADGEAFDLALPAREPDSDAHLTFPTSGKKSGPHAALTAAEIALLQAVLAQPNSKAGNLARRLHLPNNGTFRTRLSSLAKGGFVSHVSEGYALTSQGKSALSRCPTRTSARQEKSADAR